MLVLRKLYTHWSMVLWKHNKYTLVHAHCYRAMLWRKCTVYRIDGILQICMKRIISSTIPLIFGYGFYKRYCSSDNLLINWINFHLKNLKFYTSNIQENRVLISFLNMSGSTFIFRYIRERSATPLNYVRKFLFRTYVISCNLSLTVYFWIWPFRTIVFS